MGAQSNFEYRRLREVLQRPEYLPVRGRDLERETLPDPIERTQMDISPLAGTPAPKEARAKGEAAATVARGGQGADLGRRTDHGKAHSCPGERCPIGGLKVVTLSGWFAARPSGTEAVYKIYAESFKDEHHLQAIVIDAQQIVSDA
jgi:hypothetical protein